MINSNEQVLRLDSQFRDVFGVAPEIFVRAPGRVNLIGEHTDYNEGFVLPCAIDRNMSLLAAPDNQEDFVEVYSDDYKEWDRFSLKNITSNPTKEWANYLRGTLVILQNEGFKLRGFKAILSGSVPQGAGLSSSAAFEVAVAVFANELNGLCLDLKSIALLAQKAENQFIGVQCGIMDQFVSALGQEDSAVFLDCRSLEYETIPLGLASHSASIVIINSGVRRGLVDSEYNARREQCRQGVDDLSKLLGRSLNSLRDVSLNEFEQVQHKLPAVVAQRCRHVISENARVESAVQSIRNGDLNKFGLLMNQSHVSLRDDFQVSCPELDVLTELAWAFSGTIGARMTGAGFGGCAVALVHNDAVSEFQNLMKTVYAGKTGRTPELYVCTASRGAQVNRLRQME